MRPTPFATGRRGSLRVLAHAKVNLTLEVLARRGDGFHEIRSLMVPLALADRLTLAPGGKRLRIEVPNHPALEGDDNLALRAARGFARHHGLPGLTIRLEKRIPIAAGLGGGSSDAAAVLRGLALMRGVDPSKLMPIAESLGSDVPFFLHEAPAWISGRGENSAPATFLPPLWLLLAKPAFGISAADAYQAWDRSRTKAGETSLSSRSLRARWKADVDAAGVGRLLLNDLQAGCLELRPELIGLLKRLGEVPSDGVLMSGSGSTCFALFGSARAQRNGADGFESVPGEQVILTHTLPGPPALSHAQKPVARKPQLK